MNDHLDECPEVFIDCYGTLCDCEYSHFCICDALRACEQRVAEETETAMMNFFYWKPSPPHDQHYFADNICGYCIGRREALDAAVQRVKALTPAIRRSNDDGMGGTINQTISRPETFTEYLSKAVIIAAIKGDQP